MGDREGYLALCSQSYVQEADLAEQLKQRLQTFSLPELYTDWMLEQIQTWEQEESTTSGSEVQNLSAQIKANDERMEKLVSAYLDGDIPKNIYLKKKDSLMRSSLTLKDKMKDFELRRNTWVEPLREWVLDMKQATFLNSSDNFSEIADFVQKIGTNHAVRNKTARFSVPSPSHFVAERKVLFPSPAPAARAVVGLTSEEVLICAPGRNRTPKAGLEVRSYIHLTTGACFSPTSQLLVCSTSMTVCTPNLTFRYFI